MIHILLFSSDLSVYSSLFSFNGSSSSNHCLTITFPWRLCLALSSFYTFFSRGPTVGFTYRWWLPSIFFEPTLIFRTWKSSMCLPAGHLHSYDPRASQAQPVQTHVIFPPNMFLLLHPLAQQVISFPNRKLWGYLRLLSFPCPRTNCSICPIETIA